MTVYHWRPHNNHLHKVADPRGYVEQMQLFDGDVWTVEVGKSKQRWNFHQNILCKDSAFFRSAVKEDWSDDRTNTILLPEDDPYVFQVYVHWLYQGKLFVQQRNKSPGYSGESQMLIKCYIFGEKIQNVVFQNMTIDSIFAYVHQEDERGFRWYPADADTIYEGTPEGSPLRMLIVDMFAYHGHRTWIKSQRNVDFLVDLAKKLLDIRVLPSGSSPISRETSSAYHKSAPAPEAVTQEPSSMQTPGPNN